MTWPCCHPSSSRLFPSISVRPRYTSRNRLGPICCWIFRTSTVTFCLLPTSTTTSEPRLLSRHRTESSSPISSARPLPFSSPAALSESLAVPSKSFSASAVSSSSTTSC